MGCRGVQKRAPIASYVQELFGPGPRFPLVQELFGPGPASYVQDSFGPGPRIQ